MNNSKGLNTLELVNIYNYLRSFAKFLWTVLLPFLSTPPNCRPSSALWRSSADGVAVRRALDGVIPCLSTGVTT